MKNREERSKGLFALLFLVSLKSEAYTLFKVVVVYIDAPLLILLTTVQEICVWLHEFSVFTVHFLRPATFFLQQCYRLASTII